MFTLRNSTGKTGEDTACQYLKQKGYTILERNYINTKGFRLGEIDIVAEKDDILVFIEVKSRVQKGEEEILPEEAVTHRKLRKIEKVAEKYIQEHKKEAYRIEILAILFTQDKKRYTIKHIEDIF